MRLRVCPFSVAVFFATAWIVTKRQQQAKKKQSGEGEEEEENGDDKADSKQPRGPPSNSNNNNSKSKNVFRVIFVLGGPGAGKGTQCQLVQERLGWKHLSAGDLLRAERLKGGKLGDLINERVAAGALVPSEMTCQLLLNAMWEHFSSNSNNKNNSQACTQFLIDGFPRSKGNLDAWNEMTTSQQDQRFSVQVLRVLCLECPEEVLTGRLLARGKESGRVDDANLDIIRKRFQTFQQETKPIIDYYSTTSSSSSGSNQTDSNNDTSILSRIQSDQPVEQVYKQIANLIRSS